MPVESKDTQIAHVLLKRALIKIQFQYYGTKIFDQGALFLSHSLIHEPSVK